MNGIFLIIPLILIRYGLLALVNKDALSRAAFFPPVVGKERIALIINQLTSLSFFIYPFFTKVHVNPPWIYLGGVIYVLGIVLYALATFNYAKPGEKGLNSKGIYSLSRNPMYVASFFYFLGFVILTQSYVLLAILILFQISTHWMILCEERWCLDKFGEDYREYMKKVRRYF